MNKLQKIWLWFSFVLFIIPEVFFSFIIFFIFDFLHINYFPPLYGFFVRPQFFVDNPIYLFIVLGIECLGMLGLLIWNVKFNHSRYKTVLTIITALTFALLLFILYIGYAITNISF